MRPTAEAASYVVPLATRGNRSGAVAGVNAESLVNWPGARLRGRSRASRKENRPEPSHALKQGTHGDPAWWRLYAQQQTPFANVR